MRSPLTPLEFLARSTYVYPDRIAAVDGELRFTYHEFNQRVHRLASALQRHGVTPGDRVAVLTPNGIAALESHFGVLLVGGVLVMLNIRLQARELQWILNHCGAKILIANSELLPRVSQVLGDVRSIEFVTDDYEALIAEGACPLPDPPVDIDEDGVIAINYTSGTTGFPKGVMYTHRGGYLNALGEVIEHSLEPDSVYLWTLPMFHCNGWCFTWAVTAVGARHVCLPAFDPATAVELIRREGVTHLCGAPVVVSLLTQYCAANGLHFGQGLKIVTAGAPPSPEVIRAAEEVGVEIAHAYGLTETYGPHTVCAWRREWNLLPPHDRAQIKARQGGVIPDCRHRPPGGRFDIM